MEAFNIIEGFEVTGVLIGRYLLCSNLLGVLDDDIKHKIILNIHCHRNRSDLLKIVLVERKQF